MNPCKFFLISSPSVGPCASVVRYWGFSGGPDGKNLPAIVGDPGVNPELGRSPGEGNGYPLQYSCLENSVDRGAWWATVHGVTKNQIVS